MTFKILDAQLEPTALATAKHFKDSYGVGRFIAETPIVADAAYTTTLQAQTSDGHWLCVDVISETYPNALEAFVLQCKNRNLPVRLFVSLPQGAMSDTAFRALLKRAQPNGVGVVEVAEDGSCRVVSDALSLSLTGVRTPDIRAYPAHCRLAVTKAHQAFVNGDPVKACLSVFEEIEALTRRVAEGLDRKGGWTTAGKAAKKPNFQKGAWAEVSKFLLNYVDHNNPLCVGLADPVLAGLLAASKPRNDSGHRPKTTAQRKKRDNELRTRFEHGCDLFLEALEAARPLKLRS